MTEPTPPRSVDEYIKVAQGAEVLSISLRTMETLIANGEIPIVRIARRVRRIRRRDLDAYIERVTTRRHSDPTLDGRSNGPDS